MSRREMAREELRRVLGLGAAKANSDLQLSEAGYDPGRRQVRLELINRRKRLVVLIAPASSRLPCYLATDNLLFRYQGQHLSTRLDAYLHFLSKRIGGLTFAELVKRVENAYPAVGQAGQVSQTPPDRASVRPGPARQPASEPLLEGLPYSRGLPDQWPCFLSRAHRAIGESIVLRHRVAGIMHQDAECMVFPDVYANPIKSIKYPWNTRLGRRNSRLQVFALERSKRRQAAGQVRCYFTGLDESAVVMGGNDKLLTTTRRLAQSTWPEIAALSFTCTPRVIGDDVGAAMRVWAENTDRPLLYAQGERRAPGGPIIELLEKELASAEKPGARVPRSFNLVGYPAGVLEQETNLLRSLGMVENVRLLPEIFLPDCRRYFAAELQVLDRKPYLRPFIEKVFSELDLPSLFLSPPLGVKASRNWCEKLVERLGVRGQFDRNWDELQQRFLPTWRSLCRQARKHRLGFIVEAGQVHELSTGELFQNLPVLDAVREMGFSVEVLAYGQGEEAAAVPEGLEVRYFSSPRQLRRQLLSSSAAAFYSEYYYDWRLTTCGKAGFSFHDLEYGIVGALHNLRYLLGLCRTSFYRDHAGWLDSERRWHALEEWWDASRDDEQ